MLTIFDPHIDHGGYMSASHVSPDLDLSSWSADLNLAKFSSNFLRWHKFLYYHTS